ncbi:hypothetical protein PG987_007828 [Apiospora arundinis]
MSKDTREALFQIPLLCETPPQIYDGAYDNGNSNGPRSAPYSRNCAIFIRNLPPDVTYAEMFVQLRGVGKIVKLNLKPPNDMRPSDGTAATLVMWNAKGFRRALSRFNSGEIQLRGHIATGVPHRRRVAAQQRHLQTGGCSRVLQITGNPHVANVDYLLGFFSSLFVFELESVAVVSREYQTATVEVIFAAFKDQSHRAFRELMMTFPQREEIIVVYGRDPCEELSKASGLVDPLRLV